MRLTRGQHVVDQLKEALLGHVGVGEQEDGLLVVDGQLQVEDLQVLAEVGLSVASAQSDLKHLGRSGIRIIIVFQILIFN